MLVARACSVGLLAVPQHRSPLEVTPSWSQAPCSSHWSQSSLSSSHFPLPPCPNGCSQDSDFSGNTFFHMSFSLPLFCYNTEFEGDLWHRSC